ncbi:MAG: ATP phosphoribosyltransferase regulatory subunit, partial [Bacilli bacterium]|nr:ATP phosphoribosyltransferase regulatory subunit [Bacilli bacterium]
EDCHQRLELNPMRILDCKVPEDQKIAQGAPKMKDYLSLEAGKRFYETLSILNDLDIEYEIDDGLVRGLDYYGHIVFEVHAKSDAGKDYGALLGGGHYDGMLGQFGGPADIDHGVGFACGVERIYSVMKDNDMLEGTSEGIDIYAMPLGAEVQDGLNKLCEAIRDLGYSVLLPNKSGKLGAMFKKAERSGAKFALILGEDEMDRGVVQMKNLETKTQEEVNIDDLVDYLDEAFGESEDDGCGCGHHHDGDHHCCHEGEEDHECCHGEGHHHEDGEEHECCHGKGHGCCKNHNEEE